MQATHQEPRRVNPDGCFAVHPATGIVETWHHHRRQCLFHAKEAVCRGTFCWASWPLPPTANTTNAAALHSSRTPFACGRCSARGSGYRRLHQHGRRGGRGGSGSVRWSLHLTYSQSRRGHLNNAVNQAPTALIGRYHA